MSVMYLQCRVNHETKTKFDRFVNENGYPSMMNFVLEASFLYLYHPNLFERYNSIPLQNDIYEKPYAITINTIKHYYIIEKFNDLARHNFRVPTQEFSLFTYRLYNFICDHNSLPIPELVLQHYNKTYLKDIFPKIRKKKYVVEFYNLTKLLVDKGLIINIDVSSFCKMISLVLPEDIMKFNYKKRIYQRIRPFTKITSMKFKFNYKHYPEIRMTIDYPYITLSHTDSDTIAKTPEYV